MKRDWPLLIGLVIGTLIVVGAVMLMIEFAWVRPFIFKQCGEISRTVEQLERCIEEAGR